VPSQPKSYRQLLLLARRYGFTDEELEFIINYDIKYRMGKTSADEDAE